MSFFDKVISVQYLYACRWNKYTFPYLKEKGFTKSKNQNKYNNKLILSYTKNIYLIINSIECNFVKKKKKKIYVYKK